MTFKIGRRDFCKYSATSLAVGTALYNAPSWSNQAEAWLGTEQKLSLLGEKTYAWQGLYNGMLAVIQFGIKEFVPGAGVFALLFSIFAPKESNKADPYEVWKTMQQYAEALVDKKLDEAVQKLMMSQLEGLLKELVKYQHYLDYEEKNFAMSAYVAAVLDFASMEPVFRTPGYELLLLPIYAQFANLYIGLLRDGVQMGASWGMSSGDVKKQAELLTETISESISYCLTVYQRGWYDIRRNTPENRKWSEPFRSLNRYTRNMQLAVLDYVTIWPLLDLASYPNPVDIYSYLTREIYSDPYGTTSDSYPIRIPPAPTGRIEYVRVWAWNMIDAVQVSYGPHQGPDGQTITPRMGNQHGGASTMPPEGGFWGIPPDNPIVEVMGRSGDVLNGLEFAFLDGYYTGAMGICDGMKDQRCMRNWMGDPFRVSFRSTLGEVIFTERLSSIWINGVSARYQSADCAVFGFQLINPNTAGGLDIEMLRMAYIASPLPRPKVNIDRELENLLAGLQGEQVDVKKLRKRFRKENWRLLRRKYKRSMKNIALSQL